MQKIVYPSYLFCNFHKRGSLDSGKSLQSTNGVVNQTDADTGPNEIVLMTGSRTAEFN